MLWLLGIGIGLVFFILGVWRINRSESAWHGVVGPECKESEDE